jgi:hypothetical protein
MTTIIHRRKTVTQSSTISQNNKEHRINKRENSSLQVSKSFAFWRTSLSINNFTVPNSCSLLYFNNFQHFFRERTRQT